MCQTLQGVSHSHLKHFKQEPVKFYVHKKGDNDKNCRTNFEKSRKPFRCSLACRNNSFEKHKKYARKI